MAQPTPELFFFIAGLAGLICGVFLVLTHMHYRKLLKRQFTGLNGSVTVDLDPEGMVVIRPVAGTFPLALHRIHAIWPVLKTHDPRLDRFFEIQMPNELYLALLDDAGRRCLHAIRHLNIDPHAIRTHEYDPKLLIPLIALANRLLDMDPRSALLQNLEDSRAEVRRANLQLLEGHVHGLPRERLQAIHQHDSDRGNRELAGKILGLAPEPRSRTRVSGRLSGSLIEGPTQPVA